MISTGTLDTAILLRKAHATGLLEYICRELDQVAQFIIRVRPRAPLNMLRPFSIFFYEQVLFCRPCLASAAQVAGILTARKKLLKSLRSERFWL